MRKYLLIGFIFSFTFLFAQENNLIPSTSKDGKYSISHVKGWTVNFQKDGNEIYVVAPLKNLDNIPAKITLTKEEDLPKDFDLDMLTNRNTLLITNFMKAGIEDNGSSEITGVATNWVTYSYEINETPFKGLSYFFIANNMAYQMTVTCPEGDFQALEVLFKQVAQSVVVK